MKACYWTGPKRFVRWYCSGFLPLVFNSVYHKANKLVAHNKTYFFENKKILASFTGKRFVGVGVFNGKFLGGFLDIICEFVTF